jgi:hypothetical protein
MNDADVTGSGTDQPEPGLAFYDMGTISFDSGTVDRVEVSYVQSSSDPAECTVDVYIFAPGEFDEDGDPSEVIITTPAQAFTLAQMITHAAGHAAEEAGLCSGCGGPVHEYDNDVDDYYNDGDGDRYYAEPPLEDQSWRWTDVHNLAAASDQLDEMLAFLRGRLAAGEPLTAADICERTMREYDAHLAADIPPLKIIDSMCRLEVTAILRLAAGGDR